MNADLISVLLVEDDPGRRRQASGSWNSPSR
jgi:hypothetical protein